MKVQIKQSIHSYHYNGKRYLSGSILEVPDSKFVSYIMIKVEEVPMQTVIPLSIAPVETVLAPVTVTTEAPLPVKKKSKAFTTKQP